MKAAIVIVDFGGEYVGSEFVSAEDIDTLVAAVANRAVEVAIGWPGWTSRIVWDDEATNAQRQKMLDDIPVDFSHG